MRTMIALAALVARDPSNLPVYGMLAQLYLSQNKLEEARIEFDRIAEKNDKAVGIAYPLVMTGVSELLFHGNANGSIVKVNGKEVASDLIGQSYEGAQWFHTRPSAAKYDGKASAASITGSPAQSWAASAWPWRLLLPAAIARRSRVATFHPPR